MTKEKELQLQAKYPQLLEDLYGDKTVTCMHWGLTCGDGWYQLVDCTLSVLEWLNKDPKGKPYFKIAQIKEKFATIRIYLDPATGRKTIPRIVMARAQAAIILAENFSSVTCEACGFPGTRRGGMWLRTMCDKCEDERIRIQK